VNLIVALYALHTKHQDSADIAVLCGMFALIELILWAAFVDLVVLS
jgi:hypothetical protein